MDAMSRYGVNYSLSLSAFLVHIAMATYIIYTTRYIIPAGCQVQSIQSPYTLVMYLTTAMPTST